RTDAPSMNNPHRAKSQPVRLFHISFHHGLHVTRRNTMQIEDVGYRDADRLVAHSKCLPSESTCRILLMGPRTLFEGRRHRISTSLSIRSAARSFIPVLNKEARSGQPRPGHFVTCASLRAPDVRQRAEHDNGSVAPQSGPSHEVLTSSVALLRSAPV